MTLGVSASLTQDPMQMIWDSVRQITPCQVYREAENCIRALSNCAKNIDSTANVFMAFAQSFSFLPKIPQNIEWGIKASRLVSLFLVPFKIKKIFDSVIKVAVADSWSKLAYAATKGIADTGLLVGRVLGSFKILQTINVLTTTLPLTTLFNAIVLPCTGLKIVLEGWDIIKTGQIFSVIKSGCANIKTHDSAQEELEKLRNLDLTEIKKRLNLSSQCQLAEKIERLIQKLKNSEDSALDEVADFYTRMKERVELKLPLAIAMLASNIATLVGSILIIAIPSIPLIGGALMGVGGSVNSLLWNGEYYFIKRDIFDPAAQNRAQYYYETTMVARQRVARFASDFFNN